MIKPVEQAFPGQSNAVISKSTQDRVLTFGSSTRIRGDKRVMVTQRLFLALPLSDTAQATARYHQNRLLQLGFSGRLVPAHQLHVTVLFLGEIPITALAGIMDAVNQSIVGIPPISVAFNKIAGFPHPKRPRVVALTASRHLPELEHLHRRLKSSLGWLAAFPPQYLPHVTLLRGHLSWKQWPSAKNLPPISWQAQQLGLYASHLNTNGVRYTLRQTWFWS